MADGLHIYENPVGVLTNNPPFPQQMFQLNNFMHLSPKQPVNTFSDDLSSHCIQPRNGSARSSGRSVFRIPFCPGCFHKDERLFRRFRKRKRKPVLSHSRFRGSAARMLRSQPMENMRLHFILPAVMPQRGSIIIQPMKTIRSVLSICTEKIWMVML